MFALSAAVGRFISVGAALYQIVTSNNTVDDAFPAWSLDPDDNVLDVPEVIRLLKVGRLGYGQVVSKRGRST